MHNKNGKIKKIYFLPAITLKTAQKKCAVKPAYPRPSFGNELYASADLNYSYNADVFWILYFHAG